MAFNGSGSYSLPAADLPVSGQLVSSTKMNSILSDIATALSLCLARDGQSTMTGTLKMGSQKITGLADGTVSAPAVALANSTTTGLYSTGANKLAIAANGVKALEITESGIDVPGTFTAGSFSGSVSGTTGTFSGAVSGTTGTFSGLVKGNGSGGNGLGTITVSTSGASGGSDGDIWFTY